MSDFVSSNETLSFLFNDILNDNEKSNNFDSHSWCPERTNEVHTRIKSRYEGFRNVYDESGMYCPRTFQRKGNNHLSSYEDSCVGEVARLSSSMIRLLRETKERSMRSNATCGTARSARHLHAVKKSCPRENQSRHETNKNVHVPDNETVQSKERFSSDQLVSRNKEIQNGDVADRLGWNGNKSGFNIPGRGFQRHGVRVTNYSTSTVKDRQKKDSHNKVEKRRRSMISDRIKEIKSLIPEHNSRESCQRKGSILQDAICYIKTLQSDNSRLRQLEEHFHEISRKVETLESRLERLESSKETCARAYLQTSGECNGVSINPSPLIHSKGIQPSLETNVTSMSQNMSILDETYTLSTAHSISNFSLISDFWMIADD